MNDSSPSTNYYLYKISGRSEHGEFSYVGQARSAQRVLKHLSASSNGKLKRTLADATIWPSIQCMVLPEKCHGDLGIGESAFIAVERKLDSRASLNRRNESGASWTAGLGSTDYPETLTSSCSDDSELRSFPFCRDANKVAIREGVDLLMERNPLPVRFGFLPEGGRAVDRVSASELHARLASEGISSAFVVLVNAEVSAERQPMSPGTTNAQLAERCLKWWPASRNRLGPVSSNPPQALIAVLGGPTFRIVVGAWKLRPGGYDLETGECDPVSQDANFCDLQGSVLSPDVAFFQATYPIRWVHDGDLTWVGHSAK